LWNLPRYSYRQQGQKCPGLLTLRTTPVAVWSALRMLQGAGLYRLQPGSFVLCFSSLDRLKKTPQGRRFNLDTVSQGQGHGVAVVPAAALGIF